MGKQNRGGASASSKKRRTAAAERDIRLGLANNPTILVIPAEGDSPDTERVYVNKLAKYYRSRDCEARIIVFNHNVEELDIATSTDATIKAMMNQRGFCKLEIHAQGGLGAFVAYRILRLAPERVKRVFFIGGAPSAAMTEAAKFFHQRFIKFWYWLHKHRIVRFFADDPNPHNDPDVAEIKQSSTEFMRAYPELFRNQILLIGEWMPDTFWKAPCEAYFVPNGQTKRNPTRDNTYDYASAASIWYKFGVIATRAPGGFFSFYTMMPAEELFTVMDEYRTLNGT